jgi:hypothetical protein
MTILVLETADFIDLARWRWVLKDAEGRFLGDHEVRLDVRAGEYEGFLDLHAFVERRVSPGLPEDARRTEERRALLAFGAWLGQQLFGALGAVLRAHAPVTVRVRSPAGAEDLALRPFEAAIVDGETLADAHVAMVHEVEGDTQRPDGPQSVGALRILAVFSLPPVGSPLNLRAERRALRDTVAALQGGGRRAAIELRTLQYGATRETLQSALQEGDGWDIVHFSGHGGRGRLALERRDGEIDPLSAEDLAGLLREHRGRLKLVTLSACHSGAGSLAAILANLGLDPTALGLRPETLEPFIAPVARVLARSLDCAVVAMRFPVEDQFAIAFADTLYRQLLDSRAHLPQAFLRAVRQASLSPEASGLSKVTPALFGRRSADLIVATSPAPADFAPPDTGLFAFPDPPARFVGRVASLTRASAALAVDSRAQGVLFHGMAGAGKSACALELADHMRQTHRFKAWVWFKAPDRGRDVASALRDLALAMEAQLPAFAMVPVVGRDDALRQWLPRFKAVLAEQAVLIVLDNLESLLSENDTWRDPQFGAVVEALLTHNGLSRTILTSQQIPSKLPATVVVEPIHALPLAEAALLMSQPPRLFRLFHGTPSDRSLGRRLLNVVQGHPKLIELAVGLAGDVEVLDAHVTRAEAAWRTAGDPLAAFFGRGETGVSDEGFLAALADWTDRAMDAVPPASRALFEVLCVMEPDDRTDWVLRPVSPHLLPADETAGDDPEERVAFLALPLRAAGLIDRRTDGVQGWSIHPGVAARGLARVDPDLRLKVDAIVGDLWLSIYNWSQTGETTGGGPWLVRAGLAAAPYLMRQERWSAASAVLEHTLMRDDSAATASVMLAWFRMIAAATAGTPEALHDQAKLARALRATGRVSESEALARDVLKMAADQGQDRLASAVAGDLVNLLQVAGRLPEALEMAGRKAAHSRAGGLGPWTQLLDAGKRLGVLFVQGEHEAVLAEVPGLRRRLAELPPPAENETAVAWNVRETLLDLERSAALHQQQWEQALALNAEICASQAARGAEPLQLASTEYNDYQPLVALQRYPEARTLIEACRVVFEAEGDLERLAGLLAATASLEHGLRGPLAAIGFAERSLRLHYIVGQPAGCAASHFNLANFLMWAHAPPADAIAHRLAAISIGLLTQSELLKTGFNALVVQIIALGPEARGAMPGSFDTLRARVDQVDGVQFQLLVETLNHERADLDGLVQAIIEKGFQLAAGPPPGDAPDGDLS